MRITDRMNDLISGTVSKKATVERKLQAVGRNIRKNVDKGQADLKAGKMEYYGSINPLKGTVEAFKKG